MLENALGSFFNGQDPNSQAAANHLRKALLAGSAIDAPGAPSPGDGFALRVESLERTLKTATYDLSEVKFYRSIPKTKATNVIEEFNRLLEYSEAGAEVFDQGWFSEGGLPVEDSATYERAYVRMKLLGAVGSVSHVMNTVENASGNTISQETMNRTVPMLKNLEYGLFFGDSSMNPLAFDGVEKIVTDDSLSNVFDLRGGNIDESKMNDVMLAVRDSYGQPTDGYFSTGAFGDVAKGVYDRQRFFVAPEPGVLGAEVKAFKGQHGKIALHDSIFIREGGRPQANAFGPSDERPSVITVSTQPAAAPSGSSLFTADDAGTYIYQIVSRNSRGGSVAVSTAAVAVAAGDSVTFALTQGAENAEWFEIYRTPIGGAATTALLMTRVAAASGGGITTVTDNNDDIPGTSTGFVMQQNARCLSYAQLLPMTRIPLGVINTSIRWAQVIYGGLKVYTPKRIKIIKNIGRASGSLSPLAA